MGKLSSGATRWGAPEIPSMRAPSAPCFTPGPDTAYPGGEPGKPGLGWGLGRDLGALPSTLLSAQKKVARICSLLDIERSLRARPSLDGFKPHNKPQASEMVPILQMKK